jgi:hypothetical protein
MIPWISTAAAYTVCGLPRVSDTFPAANAEGVPVDTRLAVVLTGGGGCGPTTDITVELANGDGQTLISDDHTITWGTDVAATVILDPPEDLAPESAFILRAVPVGDSVVEAPFTTGTGGVAPIDGSPGITLTEWSYRRHAVAATVDLAGADDVDGVSFVRIDAGDQTVAVLAPEHRDGMALSWTMADRPSELCLVATQVDGLGREVSSDPSCLDGRGCATAPGSGIAGIAASLVLLLRRAGRRSGRGSATPQSCVPE